MKNVTAYLLAEVTTQEELNRLTTTADRLFADQEDMGHPDGNLSSFLDDVVTLLESLGGRVEGVEYKEEKQK
ncbi:hypothetical protein [Bacillus phage SBSphiJ6]|nr:hypothetical protein [Bacillus phage SBSphiJ6]